MAHNVSLLFDVEDLCWPGSDDITLDLAQFLSQHHVRGSFYVVAEKARQWAERGRTDIITALLDHDIGTHTRQHSVHPTIAEYLADATWNDGVLAAMDDEGAGIATLESVFGRRPTGWGQPGGSWGPQIHKAMDRLNMPVVVYPKTRTDQGVADLHWYADSLVFPDYDMVKFDQALTDDEQFEALLPTMYQYLDSRIMAGAKWTGIFICHPTRLKAREFWDGLNFAKGVNTPPEQYKMPTLLGEEAYQTAFKNLGRLLTILHDDPRLQLVTVADVAQTLRPAAETVDLFRLDQAIDEISRTEDIPTRFYHFSPAELLDLMARFYANSEIGPETLRRRSVGGPVTDPPPFDPDRVVIFWPDFIAACRAITNHVTDYGHLPASVFIHGVQWSIGTFYRAAIEAWFAFRSGRPPQSIEWKPGPLYPAIGHEIATTVQEDYEHWPIHQPNRDLNNLLMHTCFQCWTLKPAFA